MIAAFHVSQLQHRGENWVIYDAGHKDTFSSNALLHSIGRSCRPTGLVHKFILIWFAQVSERLYVYSIYPLSLKYISIC